MERIKIALPILVEGKYDKITLVNAVDAKIIPLSGFGVFNSKEKQHLIRRLAGENGVILLADSDAGGKQIRSFISGIVPKDKLHHVYIPQIEGKEKRKSAPSKGGLLGVEGMSVETLQRLLLPFADSGAGKADREKTVSKTDLFLDGLSGGANSKERRCQFAKMADLPNDMSANALLDAINILFSFQEYKAIVSKINTEY